MDVTLDNTYINRLARQALEEDLGSGDVTSKAVVPAARVCRARIVAKSPGVLAGLSFARAVFARIDPKIRFEAKEIDAFSVRENSVIAEIEGPARGLLAGERTALNFLQHLSGIATLTALYVEKAYGTTAKIVDTRKTVPGLRLAEKYAVAAGGGANHRLGLYDMILIKDNHLALAGLGADGVAQAITAARDNARGSVPVMVEVASIEQLEAALEAGPDFVMLDNMPLDTMRQAVLLRNEKAENVLLEASGNVNLETVAQIAATGVDRISVGALTHSAPALDIAMYIETDDGDA